MNCEFFRSGDVHRGAVRGPIGRTLNGIPLAGCRRWGSVGMLPLVGFSWRVAVGAMDCH